jgi:hypothetical protein
MTDYTRLYPMDRTPRPFVRIVLRKPDGLEYYGLTYSTHRGEIIEPITNQAALPVLGDCIGWRYDERDHT